MNKTHRRVLMPLFFHLLPDLKFKNDTGNHLLIQSKVNTAAKTITFEIYGTKDGREVSISKPTITNLTPPPPDLYIDDPSLPAGQIKQIDWEGMGGKSLV